MPARTLPWLLTAALAAPLAVPADARPSGSRPDVTAAVRAWQTAPLPPSAMVAAFEHRYVEPVGWVDADGDSLTDIVMVDRIERPNIETGVIHGSAVVVA